MADSETDVIGTAVCEIIADSTSFFRTIREELPGQVDAIMQQQGKSAGQAMDAGFAEAIRNGQREIEDLWSAPGAAASAKDAGRAAGSAAVEGLADAMEAAPEVVRKSFAEAIAAGRAALLAEHSGRHEVASSLLEAGSITPEQYAEFGRVAGRAFRTGMEEVVSQAGREGAFASREEYQAIIDEGFKLGRGFGDEFAKGMRPLAPPVVDKPAVTRTGEEMAAELIATLEREFKEGEGRMKLDLHKGALDEEGFKRAGREARQVFNEALIEGHDKLLADGLISDAESAAILAKIKKLGREIEEETGDAGRGAGEGFGANMEAGIKKFAARILLAVGAMFALGKIKQFLEESVKAFLESNRASEEMQSKVKRAGESWVDLKAAVGGAIVTMLGGEAGVDGLIDRIGALTQWVDENSGMWQEWGITLSNVASWVVRDVRKSVEEVVFLFNFLRDRWDEAKGFLQDRLGVGVPNVMSTGAGGSWSEPGTTSTGARSRLPQAQLDEIRAMTDLNKLLDRQRDLQKQLNDERAKPNPNKERVSALTLELNEVRSRATELRRDNKEGDAEARRAASDRRAAQKQLNDEIREELRLRQTLAQFGYGSMEAVPNAVLGSFRELVQLEEQLRQAQELRARAGAGQSDARIQRLQREKDEVYALITVLNERRLRPDFTDQGTPGGIVMGARPELSIDRGVQAARRRTVQTEIDALTQAYEREVSEMQIRLAQKLMSREEFEKAGIDAALSYERGLLEILKKMKLTLSPEQRKQLADLLPKVDAGKTGYGAMAGEIGQVASSLLRVTEAMGGIGEAASGALRGIIALTSSLQEFKSARAEGSIVGQLSAAAGIAAALIGVVQSVMSVFDADHALRRAQQEAMRSLERAIRDLQKAIVKDVSPREAAEDAATIARLEAILRADPDSTAGRGANRLGPQRRAALARASVEMGLATADQTKQQQIDALIAYLEKLDQKYGTNLAGLAASSDTKTLMDQLARLPEIIRELNLGGFGKDLEGRLNALDYVIATLGDAAGDAAKRLQMFIEAVREFAPEFADEFQRILTEQGADAARAWLQQQAVLLAQPGGISNLGSWAQGLTGDEVARILAEGFERLNDTTGGAGDSGSGSSGWQVTRSVTEVTANRMIGYMATQTYWLEVIARAVTGGPFDIPPVAMPSPEQLGANQTSGEGGCVFQFGPGSVVVDVEAASDPYETGVLVGEGIRAGVERIRETDQGLGARLVDKTRRFGLPVQG